ncbi:MAG: sulfite exporter TauE/SafE family protein, partial [Alphaproteobacteria bacterium]|nr:sulfite exporter TauE/SafE family protein [Alphaproteobacteria bacterium]
MFDLTYDQVAIVLVAYFFAAITKGLTGLGFSTTCLPIIVFALGLKDAFPLVIIPSITSNLIVMRQVGQFNAAVKRFWPMLLATLPGLGIGLWVLTWIDGVLASAIFGGVLFLWCAFSFSKPDLHLAPRFETIVAPISGFLTGMINGATGS